MYLQLDLLLKFTGPICMHLQQVLLDLDLSRGQELKDVDISHPRGGAVHRKFIKLEQDSRRLVMMVLCGI